MNTNNQKINIMSNVHICLAKIRNFLMKEDQINADTVNRWTKASVKCQRRIRMEGSRGIDPSKCLKILLILYKKMAKMCKLFPGIPPPPAFKKHLDRSHARLSVKTYGDIWTIALCEWLTRIPWVIIGCGAWIVQIFKPKKIQSLYILHLRQRFCCRPEKNWK